MPQVQFCVIKADLAQKPRVCSDFSLEDGQQTTRDHPKKSAPVDADVGARNDSNSGGLRIFAETKRTPAFIQSVERNAKFGEDRPSTRTRDNAYVHFGAC